MRLTLSFFGYSILGTSVPESDMRALLVGIQATVLAIKENLPRKRKHNAVGYLQHVWSHWVAVKKPFPLK